MKNLIRIIVFTIITLFVFINISFSQCDDNLISIEVNIIAGDSAFKKFNYINYRIYSFYKSIKKLQNTISPIFALISKQTA